MRERLALNHAIQALYNSLCNGRCCASAKENRNLLHLLIFLLFEAYQEHPNGIRGELYLYLAAIQLAEQRAAGLHCFDTDTLLVCKYYGARGRSSRVGDVDDSLGYAFNNSVR